MRVMLTQAGLLLEFSDEAIEYDTYIRNCTKIGLDANLIY
jgi:hypothetical protein